MARKNVLIMGAEGRDFHKFKVYNRDNKDYNFVEITPLTDFTENEGNYIVVPRTENGVIVVENNGRN